MDDSPILIKLKNLGYSDLVETILRWRNDTLRYSKGWYTPHGGARSYYKLLFVMAWRLDKRTEQLCKTKDSEGSLTIRLYNIQVWRWISLGMRWKVHITN